MGKVDMELYNWATHKVTIKTTSQTFYFVSKEEVNTWRKRSNLTWSQVTVEELYESGD